MARYKHYDLNQTKMIPLSYADQIVEGSFEYALNEIVEEHLDLSVFEHRYHNDETGRSAYDPKVLLKVVLYGYYRGIISSRRIAEACRRNVVFMALSADSRPHFTTIAAFVSSLEHEIASLFGDVLLYASELGLIGKEHFAIDGCKLPSNASKKWSGTHKELEEKRKKLERVAERIVQRHRERDGQEGKSAGSCSEPEKAQYYRRKVAEIKAFLEKNEQKRGPTGNEQKSNLTDPESAKMTSSRGVIQGYNGLAVVDDRAQIVVHAEAHGSGYEAHLLAPMIEATRQSFTELELAKDVFAEVKVTADSGFHSNAVMAEVEATGADAYIADRDYRRREPAFAEAARYKQRDKKERALRRRRERESSRYHQAQTIHRARLPLRRSRTLVHLSCRAQALPLWSGHALQWLSRRQIQGAENSVPRMSLATAMSSPSRSHASASTHDHQASRRPCTDDVAASAIVATERMRWKFDTPFGRDIYSRRMGTVEPVFGNLQNKGMRRFTLRGQRKVSAQWKLFTMVHNIEKVAGAAMRH